jgi:5-methyltetrahydrofolate--homocysteine methyltransferase
VLARRLAEAPVLLADGATGTNLFDMGLANGDAPELWLDAHPDRIAALHRAFVQAGADIILTNSFGANGRRLMLHDLQHQAIALNRRAAELARDAADASGRTVVVAGSVGPTGDLFAPLGVLTEAEALDVFAEQIEGLKQGGADVVWIETMSAPEEMRAAATAAAQAGMPWTLTASFDTAGRTMMGLMPDAFAAFAATLPTPPLAIGANCGVGAADLLVSILGLTAADEATPMIAKANAGIPVVDGDRVVYSGTLQTMELYAHLAIDAGARIVGGCCGTTPAHLAAMRRAVDAHHAGGPRPEIATIVAALGPLMQPPPSAGGEKRPGRRRSA